MARNTLTYGMALLFLISFVLLGLIVVDEKKIEIMQPKVERKMEKYIKEKKLILENTKKDPIKYNEKEKRFERKIISKKNKNLYFYLYYQKKKITSTYEEDYILGKTFLSHLEKVIKKDIGEDPIKIIISTPLNQFNKEVRTYLLKEENLKGLKIYTIEKELTVPDFSLFTIIKELNDLAQINQKLEITPKNYTIILNNSADITQSIKIENLILPNNNLAEIITGILKNDKSTEIKYNIKYTYLN